MGRGKLFQLIFLMWMLGSGLRLDDSFCLVYGVGATPLMVDEVMVNCNEDGFCRYQRLAPQQGSPDATGILRSYYKPRPSIRSLPPELSYEFQSLVPNVLDKAGDSYRQQSSSLFVGMQMPDMDYLTPRPFQPMRGKRVPSDSGLNKSN